MVASLIPKVAGAKVLAKFRPIASLAAVRKLWGYLWLSALPVISFLSLQTAFIPGVSASHGVFTLKRAAELARAWDVPLVVVQLDLKKAFDRVSHISVLACLRRKGVSTQLLAVLAQMWERSTVRGKLATVTAQPVRLDRGVPQGAPESPFIFTCVVDDILGSLLEKWRARGLGWMMDTMWLAALGYADDIIIAGKSVEEVQEMLADCIKAFAAAGLEVGLDKTHWSSSQKMQDAVLLFDDHALKWEQRITFVGTILELSGGDGAAVLHRLAQASKSLHGWAPILFNRWLNFSSRIKAFRGSACASALWLSSTWHLSKVLVRRLRAWSARAVARIAGTRRRPEEPFADYWRRIHRRGHIILQRFSLDLYASQQLAVHRMAGHFARMPSESLPHIALCTRALAWWRFNQSRWTCKFSGLHPQRFNCFRWESQIVEHYGEAELSVYSASPVTCGWMRAAQCRVSWKAQEQAFAAHGGSVPAAGVFAQLNF